MFGLFKKKVPRQTISHHSLRDEFRNFSARFSREDLGILAVTGPVGFGSSRPKGSTLWHAFIDLTAWMEVDGTAIHTEPMDLVALADDTLDGYLRQNAPPDAILKLRVRPSLDGREFLLVDLPEPAFDPDLKAILDEQKKGEGLCVDGVGTFTLNRRVNWFQTKLNWLDGTVQLTFDHAEPEEMVAAQDTIRALLADAAQWDHCIRTYAAQNLLERFNRQDNRDPAYQDIQVVPLTQKEFMARMELSSIQAYPDGSFEFWFEAGYLFLNHAIRVSGSLANGPTDSAMEG